MAVLFDITALLDDQPEQEPSNVCLFPPKVTAEAKLRSCRKMLAHWQHNLETADPEAEDLSERIAAALAPDKVKEWGERLSEAEAEVQSWQDEYVLTYRGRRFSQMEGRA